MKAGRVILLIGVGIIALMVLTVSLWLIPQATTNTILEGAVGSFWAFTIGNILFGLAMLGAAFLAKGSGGAVLVLLAGIGAILFSLWILDGAYSFMSYSPSMQAVTTVMFGCVVGDFLVGILAFVGAAFLVSARKHEISAM